MNAAAGPRQPRASTRRAGRARYFGPIPENTKSKNKNDLCVSCAARPNVMPVCNVICRKCRRLARALALRLSNHCGKIIPLQVLSQFFLSFLLTLGATHLRVLFPYFAAAAPDGLSLTAVRRGQFAAPYLPFVRDRKKCRDINFDGLRVKAVGYCGQMSGPSGPHLRCYTCTAR